MRYLIPIVLAALALAGCGGGDNATVTFERWASDNLVFSYPYHGQTEVPVAAPLVLRFSSDLEGVSEEDLESRIELRDAGGNLVDFTAALVGRVIVEDDDADEESGDQPQGQTMGDDHDATAGVTQTERTGVSVVITPVSRLAPAREYTMTWQNLQGPNGAIRPPAEPIRFTTRLAATAGRSSATVGDFRVTRTIPDTDDGFLVFGDFHSIRVQFSHPLDTSTLEAGETVTLVNDLGQNVPVDILAKDNYLTIDPRDDLAGGRNYVLILDGSIRSKFGDALAAGQQLQYAFRARNTFPRELLVARANDPGMTGETVRSRITGAPINTVPVQSTLLGDNSASSQQGDLFGDLAFVPNFPDVTPLRIPRGNLLSGTPVEVLVSGEVPAQLETGDITVTIISDAVGYLLPNQSTDDRFAPRHVRMWMDVAMSAEGTEANAALTQDVMHVEVVGFAIVEDGVLTIDAVAAIELDVLGIDRAIGALAFNLKGYDRPSDAPLQQEPVGLATLQSWLPADQVDRARPGDPIILTFDRPIYRDSVKPGTGALTVQRNGSDVDFDVRADGSALVINPEGGLDFNNSYSVSINGLARDLYDNPIGQDYFLEFTMPLFREYAQNEIRESFDPNEQNQANRFIRVPMSPRAVTTYPGYPCATEARNIAQGNHGRCVGSRTSRESWAGGNVVAINENMPVTELPANRDIRVRFSKPMNVNSFRLGNVDGSRACNAGTFRVERMTANGSTCIEPVAGRLEVTSRGARFVPDEPWIEGETYRYTMVSNGSIRGTAPHRTNLTNARADCNTGNIICSADNLPLMTRFFSTQPTGNNGAPTHTGGGPNLEIFFRGTEPTTAVFQSMVTLPTPDVNANSLLDPEERPTLVPRQGHQFVQPNNPDAGPSPFEIPLNGSWLSIAATGGQVDQLRIGCSPTGGTCLEEAFIYVNGGLDADIIGYDEDEDAVRVALYPTMIATTSVNLFATSGVGTPRSPAPTGPQFMRTRYALDDQGNRNQAATGWIRVNPDDPNGPPIFETTLDLLVDAPQTDARVYAPVLGLTSLDHNIRSLTFSLELRGPVTFLDDGRMVIAAINTADAVLDTRLNAVSLLNANVTLALRAGDASLAFVADPVKD